MSESSATWDVGEDSGADAEAVHGSAGHEEDACALALNNLQAFLHGELPESAADEVRRHLLACEKCMDNFDVEQVITALVRRCSPPQQASASLRMRITRLTITGYHG